MSNMQDMPSRDKLAAAAETHDTVLAGSRQPSLILSVGTTQYQKPLDPDGVLDKQPLGVDSQQLVGFGMQKLPVPGLNQHNVFSSEQADSLNLQQQVGYGMKPPPEPCPPNTPVSLLPESSSQPVPGPPHKAFITACSQNVAVTVKVCPLASLAGTVTSCGKPFLMVDVE